MGGTQSEDSQKQIDTYIKTTPKVKSSDLHTIWTGTNDYRLGGTRPDVAINHIKTSIDMLTAAGAKKILVANIMDLGNIPSYLPNTSASTLALLSQDHNKRLHQELRNLAVSREDLYIVPLDFNALFNAMVTDPRRFGFRKDSQSCFLQCNNPNDFIFLDIIHPTEAANRILSDYTLSILKAPQTIAAQVDLILTVAKQQHKSIELQLEQQRLEKGTKNKAQNTVFASGEVLSGEQSSLNHRSGNRNFSNTGITIGFMRNFTSDFTAGIAFHHADSYSVLSDNNGTISIGNNTLSLYAQQQLDRFFINGIVSYGWNDLKVTRPLKVTGFDTATASPMGSQLSTQVKLGYHLIHSGSSGLRITPTIGLSYHNIMIQDYREANGSILNLRVKEQNFNSLVLAIGSHLSYGIPIGKSMITPYLDVSYEHAFRDGSREITTELSTQPGIPIRSNNGQVDPDVIRLGVGAKTQIQDALVFTLGYETLLGRNSSSHTLQGQLMFRF